VIATVRTALLGDLPSQAPILAVLAQPDAAAEFREVARPSRTSPAGGPDRHGVRMPRRADLGHVPLQIDALQVLHREVMQMSQVVGVELRFRPGRLLPLRWGA
jgi:hypothetical protein